MHKVHTMHKFPARRSRSSPLHWLLPHLLLRYLDLAHLHTHAPSCRTLHKATLGDFVKDLPDTSSLHLEGLPPGHCIASTKGRKAFRLYALRLGPDDCAYYEVGN